jgi:hypothetical protein
MLSIPSRRLLRTLICSAWLASEASAGQLSYSDSVTLRPTDWQESLTWPKFDPALGNLLSVTFTVAAHIEGSAAFESEDALPATVLMTFSNVVRVFRPDLTELLSAAPVLVTSDNVTASDGVRDFGGTSGKTYAPIVQDEVATLTIQPGSADFDLFLGPGNITLSSEAFGESTGTGAGNLLLAFTSSASTVVTVTYDFEVGPEPCPCINRRNPGSLLLYPLFDNRGGTASLVTVTNTNDDFTPLPGNLSAGTVDVELVYVGRFAKGGGELPCLETNRTHRLTPTDTITLLTRHDNPNHEQGYVYAFAKSPTTGQAIVFNHLIGQLAILSAHNNVQDSVNAVVFRGVGSQGSPTDLDSDDIRDLDGVEYEEAPDEILIPRFFGSDAPNTPGGDIFKSRLILIGLSGGIAFTTDVSFLVYNDNEEQLSTQYSFRCWDNVELRDINGLFLNDYLQDTNHDPDEILGAERREAGWMRLDGLIATSTQVEILDPAIYAVLIERAGSTAVVDLPFELCIQDNGDLLPKGPFGDV